MRRPNFFISSRSHSADLLASELVLTICDQFPKTEFIGVLGKFTSKTRAEAVVALDSFIYATKAVGAEEAIKPLLLSLEENLPQLAIFFGYSKAHHELAGFFKAREVPVILYEVTPGQALQGLPTQEAHERIKTALSIHKSGSAFLRAAEIPFQYIGTPYRDRVSKVLVKKEDFDFLDQRPLIAMFPGGYGEVLERMLPRFGAFAENLLKAHDCQIVVSLREDKEFDKYVNIMKAGLSDLSRIHFVVGMHLELLSLSRLAISGSGAITIEAAISGIPSVTIYDQGEAPDESGYYSLVNQSLGQKLYPEFPSDSSIKALVDLTNKLYRDTNERTAILKTLQDVQGEFMGSATDNAADFIIQEAGLRVKKPRSMTVPPT